MLSEYASFNEDAAYYFREAFKLLDKSDKDFLDEKLGSIGVAELQKIIDARYEEEFVTDEESTATLRQEYTKLLQAVKDAEFAYEQVLLRKANAKELVGYVRDMAAIAVAGRELQK